MLKLQLQSAIPAFGMSLLAFALPAFALDNTNQTDVTRSDYRVASNAASAIVGPQLAYDDDDYIRERQQPLREEQQENRQEMKQIKREKKRASKMKKRAKQEEKAEVREEHQEERAEREY